MACCTSAFSSTTFNTPDCSVACLSTAEKGSTFVGADGSIWVLTGDDPCDVSNWKNEDCCIRFFNTTGLTDRCCGDTLNVMSSDDTVTITISEGVIDIQVKQPLPVANFSAAGGALAGTLSSTGSSSTQVDNTITRLWSQVSGPGTLTFSDTAGVSPTFTATQAGEYVVQLMVTDSNGNTSTHFETICVTNREDCDKLIEVPDSAFANPAQPTDAELQTWVAAQTPGFDCGTAFYVIGNGTATNPDYVWFYQGSV